MKYITRFAPSPTGKLHIGSARTALFDYLAAKASGGQFLLRIEDTDRARFVEGSVENFHSGLVWLGIKYDRGVVYQSERLPIYQKISEELISKGFAYKCFCTSEYLSNQKKEMEANGKPFIYNRICLGLSKEEVAQKEKDGDKYVVRFKIPSSPTEITWIDKIRGTVTFPTNILEDFIMIKSDGWPTYNLAHIVDDHEQDVTLVIRGQEFVPSTPKYILVHKALGWEHPEYAHVPEIIGHDHKKLSKRNGDVSLDEYIANGYLPEAVVNFLAFLGWNPGTTDEIFTLKELEHIFSIDRVGKSQAIFDIERLNWINGLYIRSLSIENLADRLISYEPSYKKIKNDFFNRVVVVEQTRIKTLAEFGEISAPYWQLPEYNKDMLVFKKSSPEATKKGLGAFISAVSDFTETSWSEKTVEAWNEFMTDIVVKNGLNNADVFWPIRVALSGSERSASPAEFLWALGRDESLKRIRGVVV
ncbi:MAG: glutamate--tRNA ligase [bacterium]